MLSRRLSLIVGATLTSAALFLPAQAADTTFAFVSGKGTDTYWKVGDVTEGTGGTTVTVNASQKNQTWMGLAGCFNEAGWDALNTLSESDKLKAIKLLFDKNDGIGFTFGRLPIGASDYALEPYTLNETVDDTLMTKFSINRDKTTLIPFVKAALAVKPNIHFWSSAWTPPTWMKTGAVANTNGFNGGAMKNQPKYLAANALYTAKYCEAYKAEGIPISFVFPQNEPGYCQNYPSCGWGRYRTPDPENKDIKTTEYLSTYVSNYLEDTLKVRCPETGIWYGCLSNDSMAMGPDGYWNRGKTNCGKAIIKGVGGQWNCLPIVQDGQKENYLTMCSETKCGNYPWSQNKATSVDDADETHFLLSMAPNNHAYAIETWGFFKEWITNRGSSNGVNIYSAWNMVLDTKGLNLDKIRTWPQDALLAVDRTAKKLIITPAYYTYRHLGQYVDSGAVRLGTTGGDAIAFQNPNGSFVTIAYNSTTSAAQTTIAVGGKNKKLSIPAKGWATLYVGPAPVKATKEIVRNQLSSLSIKNFRLSAGKPIHYSANGTGLATMELMSLNGAKIGTIMSEKATQGEHSFIWNGKTVDGKPVSSAVAVLRLTSPNGSVTKTVMAGR